MSIHNPIDLSDEVVTTILSANGWTAARAIDINAWIIELEDEGYFVFPQAREVLANLGGLEISPPSSPAGKFCSGEIIFNPRWAATGEQARIKRREIQLSRRFVPIGEWLGEYILLLSDQGEVFAETTFQMLLIGENFSTAMRNLLLCDTELVSV